MRPYRRASAPVICALLATAACGSGPSPSSGAVAFDTLTVQDTIVTTASELVGLVADLAIGADGRLYLADSRLKRVLTVQPDGTDPHIVGREGAGPGEFAMPWTIGITNDTLRVFDMQHARVQTFDLLGAVGRSYLVPAEPNGRGLGFNRVGHLAVATGGRDSTLVAVVDPEGSATRSFGQPVVPPTTFWDFGSIKERIRKGEVPDEYRNNALPVWASDGSVFVVFYAEPEVRRYAPDGALLWSRPLSDPALEGARAAFIRKNTEEKNPAFLHTLQYVQDARVVGDDVWLLLNTADGTEGALLVLDGADGALRRRISLTATPDTRRFGVDLERRRLYITVPGEAMVVAFALK